MIKFWRLLPESWGGMVLIPLASSHELVNCIVYSLQPLLRMIQNRREKGSHTTFNIFSQLFWSTRKVFSRFIQNFQEFMTSLFDTADKNGAGNEKSNLLDRSLKACMMLAVLVLAIFVFKRSALLRRWVGKRYSKRRHLNYAYKKLHQVNIIKTYMVGSVGPFGSCVCSLDGTSSHRPFTMMKSL